jgi:homoserine dehydrogenase
VTSNPRLGILGLGTVGSGLVRLIRRREPHLRAAHGVTLQIGGAAVRSGGKPRAPDLAGIPITTDPLALARSPETDIVVELIGGFDTALDCVRAALEAGKPVVTANKALLAHHGPELYALARERGVPLFAEASVGGGIPILKALRESLVANEISSLVGILNGTTNYVLTRMEEDGVSYFEALRMADERGYTEADPSLDIEGIDAKHKLQILAAHLCGGAYPEGEILREGIGDVTARDFFFARRRGLTIKLLAIARKSAGEIELRVHPALVPRTHPLAGVRDQFNAIVLEGDAVGEIMLYGAGAGAMPTASSVYADIVDICTRVARGGGAGAGTEPTPLRIKPASDVESEYYLRVTVSDEPGVIGEVATILGAHGISVSSVAGELIPNAAGLGDLEIVIHRTREGALLSALASIDGLPRIRGRTRFLRLLGSPGGVP